MTRDPAPEPREADLSEDAAHRLLARAVELDAHHGAQISVAQLREVAREAGIAPAAFDEALAEMRALRPTEATSARPGLAHRLWRRLRSVGAPPSATDASRRWWDALTTNVLAFGAFWVLAGVLSRIAGSLGLDWPARHGALIVANVIGLGIALRLRGRVTAVVLGVTAAAQLAEYPMHLMFGIETVQGGPTKWALMLAGLLGIAIGTVFARSRNLPAAGAPAADAAPAAQPAGPAAPARTPPANLRLRAASAWRRLAADAAPAT